LITSISAVVDMVRTSIGKIAKLSPGFVILLGSYAVIGILLQHDLSAGTNVGGIEHRLDIVRLQPFVLASAFGAALLGYVLWDSQRPLWEIRDGKKARETRKAAFVALAFFLIATGAGYGALSLVEITRLDKSTQIIVPWIATLIIGTALLVFAVFAARGPLLFNLDEAPTVSSARTIRRRLVVGAVMTSAGAALFSYVFWYGSAKYIEYAQAYKETELGELTLEGLLVAGTLFLAGILTLTGNVPFPHARSKLYPYDDSLERK